jgi:hypothetical protein
MSQAADGGVPRLILFYSHSRLRKQYRLLSPSYLSYVPFRVFSPHVGIFLIMHQVAKGVNNSYDELADLLESIENLLKPLDIYARIPLTPAMDGTVVKIMVELLSTLALTTKELKQGRSSVSVLSDVSPF